MNNKKVAIITVAGFLCLVVGFVITKQSKDKPVVDLRIANSIPQNNPPTPSLRNTRSELQAGKIAIPNSKQQSNAPLLESVITDNTAPDVPPPSSNSESLPPVVTGYPHPVATFGQLVRSTVTVDGKDYQLTPNQIGIFERVYVKPEAIIPVKASYPEATSGDPVIIESEDGGQIMESQKIIHVEKLDQNHSLAFHFQPTQQGGIYRVVLRKGADVKQLEFWVGEQESYQ